MSTEKKAPPVEKINVGPIKANIWRYKGKERPFYKTSFEYSYKDGDQWKTSNSYGLRELILLVKAAMLAHSAILKLTAADKKGADQATQGNDDGYTEGEYIGEEDEIPY